MFLKICVLRSGSSGNCTLVWSENSAVIIDMAGIDPVQLKKSLVEMKVKLKSVGGILITHGHQDHLHGMSEAFSCEHEIPVFMHKETYQVAVEKRYADAAGMKKRGLIQFFGEKEFEIGGIKIKPFPVPHEGIGYPGRPSGFRLSLKGKNGSKVSVGYATDLGSVPAHVFKELAGCSAIVIETNHDVSMVKEAGAYHSRWLLSDSGHLNNHDAGLAIVKLVENGSPLRKVFLAHVSMNHNTHELAEKTVSGLLEEYGIRGITLYRTNQHEPSEVVKVAVV